MKTLLILRHAKSSWDNSSLADHDRPLNKRGKRDAPKMGRLLAREDLTPDLIISSTAERALTTAEFVAISADYDKEIQTTRQLYHAGPEDYIEVLQKVSDINQRVMIVGHNPGIEDMVEELSGQYERMQTAALAQIELPINSWSDLDEDSNGRLVNIWRPKEI